MASQERSLSELAGAQGRMRRIRARESARPHIMELLSSEDWPRKLPM